MKCERYKGSLWSSRRHVQRRGLFDMYSINFYILAREGSEHASDYKDSFFVCKFAGNSDPLRGIIASNSDPF